MIRCLLVLCLCFVAMLSVCPSVDAANDKAAIAATEIVAETPENADVITNATPTDDGCRLRGRGQPTQAVTPQAVPQFVAPAPPPAPVEDNLNVTLAASVVAAIGGAVAAYITTRNDPDAGKDIAELEQEAAPTAPPQQT